MPKSLKAAFIILWVLAGPGCMIMAKIAEGTLFSRTTYEKGQAIITKHVEGHIDDVKVR